MSGEKPYVTLVDSNADRIAWLRARQQGIAASEIAAVLGLDPWRGRLAVAASKHEEITDDTPPSEYAEAGQWMEPVIGEWFVEETKKHARSWGVLLQSRAYPWMLATPDWLVAEDSMGAFPVWEYPLQIKNTTLASEWDDGVPARVLAQCHGEMLVMGVDHGYVAVLINGWKRRWDRVELDQALAEEIVEQTNGFWGDVVEQRPIEADGSRDTSAVLKRMFPTENGGTVALPGELLEVADRLDAIGEEMKALKDEQATLENRVIQAVGPATYGVFSDGSGFSYKEVAATEIKAYRRKAYRTLRRTKART